MKMKIYLVSSLFFTIMISLIIYQNFILNGFSSKQTTIDLTEFKSINHSLNEEFFRARSNLGSDLTELNSVWNNFENQKNIIVSQLRTMNFNQSSVKTIEDYFQRKSELKIKLLKSIDLLSKNIILLNPQVDLLAKLNIKFSVDRKDFYKELVLNSFYFILNPNQSNIERYKEDKKILHQVLTYSTITNPNILKLKEIHDLIYDETLKIEQQMSENKSDKIEIEVNKITALIAKNITREDQTKKNFVYIILGLLGIYLLVLFYFLKDI